MTKAKLTCVCIYVVPDSVGEEKVWRMDWTELWQEGGRDWYGDVTSGCHTAFVMNISKQT